MIGGLEGTQAESSRPSGRLLREIRGIEDDPAAPR